MNTVKVLISDLSNPQTPLGALFFGLVVLILAALVSRGLRLAVARVLAKDPRQLIDRTTASFLTQLIPVVTYLIALILYAHLIPELRSLGTALLTGVGIASVVIGLAAQATLSNLIAGIAIVIYRPFQLGDRIQINAPMGAETGTVESLTLGYTVLQTFDNRRVVVPNSAMSTQVLVNLTAKSPQIMSIVPIGISYDADLDKARGILMQIARQHPGVQEVLDCPVTKLGEYTVVLSLRAWCTDSAAAKQFEYDLYEQAKTRFDQEGIELPFPYTNVVLKKERQGS